MRPNRRPTRARMLRHRDAVSETGGAVSNRLPPGVARCIYLWPADAFGFDVPQAAGNVLAAGLLRIVTATPLQGARCTGGRPLRNEREGQAPVSLLKTEPPAPVASLPELFAIAHALEQEAANRYATLAAEMEALELPRVAAVFRHLVDEERGHAEHVEHWALGATGAGPDHHRMRWQPPETFDEEEARTIASSRLASAYRALSMAVRNEERAFALWTYIAAQARAPEVRAAAERMAGEELRHAALLRRERRRAYREDRSTAAASGAPSPLARAMAAEWRLAALLPMLAEAEGDATRAAAWRRLAGEAARMAAETAALAGEDALPGRSGGAAGQPGGSPARGLQRRRTGVRGIPGCSRCRARRGGRAAAPFPGGAGNRPGGGAAAGCRALKDRRTPPARINIAAGSRPSRRAAPSARRACAPSRNARAQRRAR